MFEKPHWSLLALLLIFASGCEQLYYSALKTSGTWTGTATTLPLVNGGTNQTVPVVALRITSGPDGTNPPQTSRVKIVGREFVLVDDRMQLFEPGKWTLGAALRVTGLMRTDVAFDEHGKRLYATIEKKYLVPSIRVKSAEPADQGAASAASPLLADLPATTSTTKRSTEIKLIAKAVSSERIDLTWTPVKGADFYRVEVSDDGKEFNQSAEMDASEPRCSNEGFEPNEHCYFRVTAVRSNGTEVASNIADATTLSKSPSTKP